MHASFRKQNGFAKYTFTKKNIDHQNLIYHQIWHSGFNRLTRPAKIYICLTQVICWTILLRFSLPLVTNTDLICNLDNLKAQETPGKERKSKRIAFALKVPGVSSAEGYCSFLARTWVMFRPKTSTSWTGWRPKSDLRRVDILEHFGWLGFWFWGVVQGVINVCYRPRVRLCGEERARLGRATATAEESRPPTSGTVPPQSVQPLQGAGSLNLLAVSYPLPALKTSTIQKHVRRKFLTHWKIQLALRWVVLVPFLLAQALLPTSTSMPTEEHPTSTLEAVLNIFLERPKSKVFWIGIFFSEINLLHLSLFFATLSSKFWQTA